MKGNIVFRVVGVTKDRRTDDLRYREWLNKQLAADAKVERLYQERIANWHPTRRKLEARREKANLEARRAFRALAISRLIARRAAV